MTVKLRADQKGAKILGAKSLYPIMREILLREKGIDKNRERLWVCSLGADSSLLNIELIAIGSVSAVTVEASAVFSIALQKDSKGIIMVHNHPNGDAEPSLADHKVTELMAAIGELVNVPLIDDMILGAKGYFSYEEKGIMDDYRKLINASDPRKDKEVQRLKLELMDALEEAREYKKKMERMAKQLQKTKGTKPSAKKAVPKKKAK